MKKKLSLHSSIIAVLLCMAMIAGATFALFSSTKKINIAVNAAGVDVTANIDEKSLTTYSMGVEQAKNKFELGGTAEITVVDEIPTLTLDQVAPGDKVTFEIDMTNASTIDVIYRVTWLVDGKLSEALVATVKEGDVVSNIVNNTSDWAGWKTSDAKEKTVTVSIELPYETGNEYQGKTASISFTVEAVQGNADVTEIKSEDHLQTLVLMGGGEAALAADVTLTKSVTIPAGVEVKLNLNGYSITTDSGNALVNKGTLIIDGNAVSTYAMRTTATEKASIVSTKSYAINNSGNMIISNIATSGIYNAGSMVINNCDVANVISGRHAIYHCGTALEINGGTFSSTSGNELIHAAKGGVVINDGEFTMIGKSYLLGQGNHKYITIYGGTFNGYVNAETGSNDKMRPGCAIVYGGTFNFDPTAWLAEGKTVATVNKTYVVVDAGRDVVNVEGLGNVVVPEGVTADEVVVVEPDETITPNQALANAIADILAAGNDAIYIATPGKYNLPASLQNKTFTISGNKDVEIEAANINNSYEGCDYVLSGANVVFDGVTISTAGTGFIGYAGLKATYNNCVINNSYWLYDSSVFNNCTFNVSGDAYNIWTWSAPTVEFNNCTFNSSGKALLLYGGVNTVMTVNNCVFNDDNAFEEVNNKAAIETGSDYGTGYTLIVNNTVVNGFDITTKGTCTGTTLFGDKNDLIAKGKLNVTIDGFVYTNNVAVIRETLAAGGNVKLISDVTMTSDITAPYGNKYAIAMNGGILDGNGFELEMVCYGDDYGIMTTGGTIKNVTIKEGTRAIMVMYVESDVILENVHIGGDGVLYPINTGEEGPAAKTAKLIVKNSTLAGWTSYEFLASATFENVTFEQGTYYNNIYGRVFKPYVSTTLIDCKFVESMNLDLSALGAGQTVTMTGCTVNGVALNADVISIPTCDADYDTKLFTVDTPRGRELADCLIFN